MISGIYKRTLGFQSDSSTCGRISHVLSCVLAIDNCSRIPRAFDMIRQLRLAEPGWSPCSGSREVGLAGRAVRLTGCTISHSSSLTRVELLVRIERIGTAPCTSRYRYPCKRHYHNTFTTNAAVLIGPVFVVTETSYGHAQRGQSTCRWYRRLFKLTSSIGGPL